MQIASTKTVKDTAKCVLNLEVNASHLPAEESETGNQIVDLVEYDKGEKTLA